MQIIDVAPVYKRDTRFIRRFVVTDDCAPLAIFGEAVDHARYLANEGIPFVVRADDKVISGRKWLSKNDKQ